MGHFIVETDKEAPEVRLVNAKTSMQAFRFVADAVVTVRAASAADVYSAAKNGIELEDAKAARATEAQQAGDRG